MRGSSPPPDTQPDKPAQSRTIKRRLGNAVIPRSSDASHLRKLQKWTSGKRMSATVSGLRLPLFRRNLRGITIATEDGGRRVMGVALRAKKISGGVAHDLPADLKKALTSDAKALATWEDITPLARNE